MQKNRPASLEMTVGWQRCWRSFAEVLEAEVAELDFDGGFGAEAFG
jgi:hypothetical protein